MHLLSIISAKPSDGRPLNTLTIFSTDSLQRFRSLRVASRRPTRGRMGAEVPLTKSYPLIQEPIIGRYLERINRFACFVDIHGQPEKVYLPNSGRLEDLLIPGVKVMLEKRRECGKTLHDFVLSEAPRFPDRESIWVGMDSRLPNQLLTWAIKGGLVSAFDQPDEIRHEPKIDDGRLDLKIVSGGRTHWIETKSVNLLDLHGTARFPDAPTMRGSKHLSALMDLVARNTFSWVVFIVMREDALAFSPFSERDPTFSEILDLGKDAGVGILAYSFAADHSMTFQGPLPVVMPANPFPGAWTWDSVIPGAGGSVSPD